MIAVFTKEYGIITRVTRCEYQRSGYNSADALHKSPAAKTSTTTPEYYSMSEYAAALEDQVTALQTVANYESSETG